MDFELSVAHRSARSLQWLHRVLYDVTAARAQPAQRCMRQHLPKLVFGASVTLATAAIYYSHWSQVEDKRLMHQAVIRDKQRLKEIKRAQQEK